MDTNSQNDAFPLELAVFEIQNHVDAQVGDS